MVLPAPIIGCTMAKHLMNAGEELRTKNNFMTTKSLNSNLRKANRAKNDEFYTQLVDVEKELKHYKDQFRGKVIYCNCDDPFESNFFKYFAANFNALGLKQLIATSYKPSPIANTQLGLFGKSKTLSTSKGRPKVTANKFIINEVDDTDDMTAKYGTDALRIALVVGNPPGSDTALSENKIKGYKNFANKLWNIARFILNNIEEVDFSNELDLCNTDKVLVKNLENTVNVVTANIEKYRMDLAAEILYHYIWHDVADRVLEESKLILSDTDEQTKISRQHALYKILLTSLKLLHPFMPFITEEIWRSTPNGYMKKNNILMMEPWPIS